MENRYQVPRGTQDFLGSDTSLWQKTEQIIREECEKYGYQEIRTPIFEHTEVFKTENDSSDMVTKEMYTFTDNGERSLTLRPEGTKGVIRAFVEHKLYGNTALLPQKLYYMGPMFRYERPQKGRYRQFHQFGVEAIGAKSPMLDVECIALGYRIATRLGIRNLKILVNSLGDDESRNSYRQALREHFKPHLSELCPDCQRRYEVNPLRILDCKEDRDKDCFRNVPSIQDYLTQPSREYFQQVVEGLKELDIPYIIDDHLVRGLDYYTNTVFEAVPVNAEGQQATVFGGGQYDGLVNYFGGGELPGIGFGMGLERIIALALQEGGLKAEEKTVDVYVISLGDVGTYALKVTEMLRSSGLKAETDYLNRSLKAQFKASDRLQSRFTVIAGENEKDSNTVELKDNVTRNQETVKTEDLVERIRELSNEQNA